jgi:sugar lactone lactonase YvrE
MRRIALLALAAAALAAPAALAGGSFPKIVPLPDGFQPEGIEIAGGPTFYVGSRSSGAVYRGSLRTGKGAVLVQGAPGRFALGIELDHGRLIVAGGPSGKAFVYSARTGKPVADFQLASGSGATFINDLVVTKGGAYFTDSNRAAFYKLPIGRKGELGAPRTIPLSGDFQLVSGFNLNGIVASSNGRTLVAVQSMTGKLYAIDARTGRARLIDLGGAIVPNGDGLLLDGKLLYVVRNQDNLIAVVRLGSGFATGRIVRMLTDPALDVPATIDRFGKSLYAVNARFTTAPTPTTPYQVVRIGK